MISMLEGEIDCCGSSRIVSDRNDFIQVQRLDNRFEVPLLLFESVAHANRLVGSPVAQEIEANNPSPRGGQMRNRLIVNVQVVWKSMQDDEGGTVAGVACVELALRALMAAKSRR